MMITIPVNQRRFPIVFFISTLIPLLLVINLLYTQTEGLVMNGLFNYIFNSLVLLPFLLYSIVSFADYMKTKFDKHASFKITEDGLIDNLSIFSCGKVQWEDIKGIELTNYFNTKFLIIRICDNRKYLRSKNIFHRYVLSWYIKQWGTPVVVSERRVAYNLDDLRQVIMNNIQVRL